MRLSPILFLTAALALAIGGCGSPATVSGRDATLVLDFTPNAIHAGIYSAVARGFDRAEGVHLHVVSPSASSDSIRRLRTGRANFAILDIHDLAIARERGSDIVAIMALVQRPLGSVIATPAIHSPSQLQGKTVGVTGVPSDRAVLRSTVAGAGGDPRKLKTITIGFDAVAGLLSGRIAAATSFWNDEGVTLARTRPGFHVFRVDEYGAPSYPELVLCATRSSLRRDAGLAHAVTRALVRGYGVTVTNPSASAGDLESLVSGLDPSLLAAQERADRAAWLAPGGKFGKLNLKTLRAWANWEARFGIVRHPPDVSAAFDPRFVAGSGSGRGS